jgi:hypothetical protein
MEENDVDKVASSVKQTTGVGHTEPRVVKFAYKEFRLSGEKWMAVCQKCKKRIQDTVNVTSAFTK